MKPWKSEGGADANGALLAVVNARGHFRYDVHLFEDRWQESLGRLS